MLEEKLQILIVSEPREKGYIAPWIRTLTRILQAEDVRTQIVTRVTSILTLQEGHYQAMVIDALVPEPVALVTETRVISNLPIIFAAVRPDWETIRALMKAGASDAAQITPDTTDLREVLRRNGIPSQIKMT